MRKIAFYFIPLLLAGMPYLAAGQPLQDLLHIARQHNPELKALQQEYLAGLEKAPQVSQLPDPQVEVGAFAVPVETRLGAQNIRLSASQMFPWFGTLDARESLALANARALDERVASRLLELEYRVKDAWFQLYGIEASQQVIQRNIRILEILRELALAKVESGKASTADVLRVDLKIEALQQELLILQNQMEKPSAEINQVLNRPIETEIKVLDTLVFASMPYQKDTLLQNIRANHPMIRMFSLQQEASRKAIELNHLEGMPSFGAGLDYIMVSPRSDADPSMNGRDIFQVSAKVNIPLWREKYRAREREENLKIDAFEYRKTDLEKRFLSMIEQAYSDYETARLRMELYEKQIRMTRSAIRILEADYSSSGRNFDELLRLEQELVDYDLKKIQAVVDSQVARAGIERYITYQNPTQ